MSEQQENTEQAVAIKLTVNGVAHAVSVPAIESLLQTLRDRLHISSVRGTCGIGVCGSCTVLLDGQVASSCIMLTVQASRREITTAEGLRSREGKPSRVQEAFLRHGAYQCSFCIPGMTLAVHAALADPEVGKDRAGIREYLAGNLCRCGTYPEILAAVTDLVDHETDNENSAGDD